MPLLQHEGDCVLDADDPPDLLPERVEIDKLRRRDEAPQLEPQNLLCDDKQVEQTIMEDPPLLEKQAPNVTASRKVALRDPVRRTPEPPLLTHSESEHSLIDAKAEQEDPPLLAPQVDLTSISHEPPKLDRFDSQDKKIEAPPVLEPVISVQCCNQPDAVKTQENRLQKPGSDPFVKATTQSDTSVLVTSDAVGPSEPGEHAVAISRMGGSMDPCQTPLSRTCRDVSSEQRLPLRATSVTTPGLYSPSLPLGQQNGAAHLLPPLESPLASSSQQPCPERSVTKSLEPTSRVAGKLSELAE